MPRDLCNRGSAFRVFKAKSREKNPILQKGKKEHEVRIGELWNSGFEKLRGTEPTISFREEYFAVRIDAKCTSRHSGTACDTKNVNHLLQQLQTIAEQKGRVPLKKAVRIS